MAEDLEIPAPDGSTRDSVRRERDELRLKLDNLSARFQALEAENAERRRQLSAVKTDRDGVWLWQGGGDRAESLACPVVMAADTLRALVAEMENAQGQVAVLRRELEVAGGFILGEKATEARRSMMNSIRGSLASTESRALAFTARIREVALDEAAELTAKSAFVDGPQGTIEGQIARSIRELKAAPRG